MSHAAHFNKVGASWWNDLVYSESYTITKHLFNPSLQPYGDGTDGDISAIISLAESWAEHVAEVFSNIKYGTLTNTFKDKQGNTYDLNLPVSGLGAHLNAIEDFSPNRTGDPFRWIPEGIYYDMTDNRNDLLAIPLRVDVDDQVNAYTNNQLFQALDGDVKSMPQYRTRVLLENSNNQIAQVNLLFNGYHY